MNVNRPIAPRSSESSSGPIVGGDAAMASPQYNTSKEVQSNLCTLDIPYPFLLLTRNDRPRS
jgi:hypothetical protein